jgi:hypothetical protein
MYCSPNNTSNIGTCFSNLSLIKIAKEYNKDNKHVHKIKIPEKLNNDSRIELWNNIKKAMMQYTPCSEDYCYLQAPIIKNLHDSEINNSFRPEKPLEWYEDKHTWLSTIDIDEVMSQYEKNTDFIFIGPVPIDFDYQIGFGTCVANELCKLDIYKQYINNKRKIGVVFNLDPHYMSGSHWTALYSDLDKGGVYYFDSYGTLPPKEVIELMRRMKVHGNQMIQKKMIDINKLNNEHNLISNYQIIDSEKKKLKVNNLSKFQINTPVFFIDNINSNIDNLQIDSEYFNTIVGVKDNYLELDKPVRDTENTGVLLCKGFQCFYNDKRFQFKNSECGVFSMHFITEMLSGKKFDDVITNIIKDDEVNKKRDFFYRPNIKKIISKK